MYGKVEEMEFFIRMEIGCFFDTIDGNGKCMRRMSELLSKGNYVVLLTSTCL